MFYNNARHQGSLSLPKGSPGFVAGGIIAASAVPLYQLERLEIPIRPQYRYLQRRLFDPQLYLAELSASLSRKYVGRLATYPWFGSQAVESYNSNEHTYADYAQKHESLLISGWKQRTPQGAEIAAACKAAVEFQLRLGCEAVILPGPLTKSAESTLDEEVRWMDEGLAAARAANPNIPVLASFIVTQDAIRAYPAKENGLISRVADQVAARELTGMYLMVEQTMEVAHFALHDEVTARAILHLTDLLANGARKRIVVNYMGHFGCVAAAAGAEIWASGFDRSQRRFSQQDYVESGGMGRPHYFSAALAGDIGVESDLDAINEAGLLSRVVTKSPTGEPLIAALKDGRKVDDVVAWRYRPGNVPAARSHHMYVHTKLGAKLNLKSPSDKIAAVGEWLEKAVAVVEEIETKGLSLKDYHTEVKHQRYWLKAYRDWLADRA